MLPPSHPEWTDVSRPGVSRPPRGPPDDVYPIATERTITPRRDRPPRLPRWRKSSNKGVGETLQKRFRFYSLNDNVPTVLAVANDMSYEEVFAQQLRNYLCPDDLVVAISGSGNSPNVLEAVRYAASCGVETVGLVGYDGGQLKKLADHCIHVPVDDMQKVDDLHLVANHVMTTLFRLRLSGTPAA